MQTAMMKLIFLINKGGNNIEKKNYETPAFDLVKLCFENMLIQQLASDPETSGDEINDNLNE